MSFKKNQAVTGFPFNLYAPNGDPVTSGTTTGYVKLDGGTQSALTNTPVHRGNGQWSVDLLATEMNGDIVGLVFTNPNAVNSSFTISTYDLLDANLKQINDETLPVDNIRLQYNGTGIQGDNFPSTQSQVNVTDGKVDDIGSTTTDTNTKVTSIQGDYSTFDPSSDGVVVTTNNDKTGYSISGTITTLDGLNNFDPANDTVAIVTTVTAELSVNTAKINGVTVIGDGTSGNLWRS